MAEPCPTCGGEYDRVWVVEDLDQPFGCTACIRKRGLQSVEATIAARAAWPQLDMNLRAARVVLALSPNPHAVEKGSGLTSTAASLELIQAAARLLGQREVPPPPPA